MAIATSSWVFPPPSDSLLFTSSSFETSILTYLNSSTTSHPLHGFGKTATYHADAMNMVWPTNGSPQPNRTWHCMPCYQRLDSTEEWLNWDACRYDTKKDLPALYSVSFSLKTVPGQNDSTYTLNYISSLPQSTKDQALMCTFNIPDKLPYDFTLPFRFVNTDRKEATGENMYIFNALAPEGNPLYLPPPPTDDKSRLPELTQAGIASIILACIVVFLGIVLGLLCCLKRRKNKKAATKAEEDSFGKSKDADEETLPGYETPPAYNEASECQEKAVV